MLNYDQAWVPLSNVDSVVFRVKACYGVQLLLAQAKGVYSSFAYQIGK